jgi:hypothetical protein
MVVAAVVVLVVILGLAALVAVVQNQRQGLAVAVAGAVEDGQLIALPLFVHCRALVAVGLGYLERGRVGLPE